jgi:hypothetical protein
MHGYIYISQMRGTSFYLVHHSVALRVAIVIINYFHI